MCLRLVAFHAHACRTDGHARRSATRDAILNIRVCAYGYQVQMVRVAHVVSRALIPHLTFQPDAGALVAPWAPSWTIVWQHVRGGEGEWRVRTCACALHMVPSQGGQHRASFRVQNCACALQLVLFWFPFWVPKAVPVLGTCFGYASVHAGFLHISERWVPI